MKTLILAASLLLSSAAQAGGPFTLGLGLSNADALSAWASYWVATPLSLDLRLSPASIDAGVTGHITVAGDLEGGLHQLLVTGAYGHRYHPYLDVPWVGSRILVGGGYGYVAPVWEVRALLAQSFEHAETAYGLYATNQFTALLLLGYRF